MLPPTRNSRETDSVMKKPTHIKSAFSLVELLVVIAVIAIIAAIAIPNIAGITGSANVAKAQRNAQNIVSTFSALRAAGYNVAQADKAAAIAIVTAATPVTGTGAAGNGMSTDYSIGGLNMPAAEVTLASAYIAEAGTGADLQLIYDADGGN